MTRHLPDVPTPTPWHLCRDALHRHVDRICDAWPHALTDIDAIGFPSCTLGDGTPGGHHELTSVEAAANALCHVRAVAWLAELADVIVDLTRSSESAPGVPWGPANARPALHTAIDDLMTELPVQGRWDEGPLELVQRTDRLANRAAYWWPTRPPTRGQTINGVTIGERGNHVEKCHLCDQPVTGGHGDPIRRIDGEPYHRNCYLQVWRQRRRTA